MGKALAIIACIFVGLVVVGSLLESTNANKSDPSDMMSAANRKADPTLVPAVQALIRLNGYECPAVTRLWAKGASPYGPKFEALCGPDDGSGNSYSRLHYAVYITTAKVNACGEFGAFEADCS